MKHLKVLISTQIPEPWIAAQSHGQIKPELNNCKGANHAYVIMSFTDDDQKLLIISNWFRQSSNSNISIDNICKIIIEFSKMCDKFIAYGYNAQITNNGLVATNTKYGSRSIYCEFNIPNETQQTFTWKFMCCSMLFSNFWGIGIDAMKNAPKYNSCFYSTDDKINYFYKANGGIWQYGRCLSGYNGQQDDKITSGWKKEDIITLKYNGKVRELSIAVNETYDKKSILNVKESEGGFRVVAFMNSKGDQIQLLQ